jgi:serine/threonine protein kinase
MHPHYRKTSWSMAKAKRLFVDSVCLSFRTYVDLSRALLYLTWKCGLQSTSDVSRARWFAPERITTTSVTPPTEEVDVWSFGLLCLEVFTGEDPYRSYSDFYVPVLLKEGTTPEHPGSTAVGLTSRMWELMQSCWQINPAERPLMSEIQSTVCSMLPRRRESLSFVLERELPLTPDM